MPSAPSTWRLLALAAVALLLPPAQSSDWAVRLEAGADADALAARTGLVNAGEAVPDSGVYHFKLPRSGRRSRREAAALSERATAVLSGHDQVAEVEHQDTPLVRVRRIPVPFPQSASGSSPPELCFLNTEATSEREARRCVFPFRYKGRTYLECTADHSVNGKQWCATEVITADEI